MEGSVKMSEAKIAVLMGGVSNEREVSLRSGENVVGALKGEGLKAFALDVRDDRGELLETELRDNDTDIAFIALHGRYGEDGCVQSLLERLSIPYTGSGIVASAGCFNKYGAKQLFEHAGVVTPRYVLASERKPRGELLNGMDFPIVVKPCSGGSTIGTSICRQKDDLGKAIDVAFEEDSLALIEEYIAGREVTLSVIGDEAPEALPIIEIRPRTGFYDYRAKYEKGMSKHIVPAKLSIEEAALVQEQGLTAYRVLGCRGFGRVDMIIGQDGKVYVLEINTIPGLTETSLFPEAARAAGISFGKLCVKLLEMAKW